MFKIILVTVVIVMGHVIYNKIIYPYLVDKSMEPYIKMEESEKDGITKS